MFKIERWLKGFLLTIGLSTMVVSNKFINLGPSQRFLCIGEIAFLVFALLKLSGYSRKELGIGGEFSFAKHVLFPFVFFVLPLIVVVFVPPQPHATLEVHSLLPELSYHSGSR